MLKAGLLLICIMNIGIIQTEHIDKWDPQWTEADSMKELTDIQIKKIIEGEYQSKYLIHGRSEPRPYESNEIVISNDGILRVFSEKKLITQLELKLDNKNGYITVTPVLKEKSADNLPNFNTDIFSGLLYISKNHKQIMFGNNIEIDGGPASAWERVK